MSIIRLFSGAALGGLSPTSIAPTRSAPTRPAQPQPNTQNEDAALISLSSAAREFVASTPANRLAEPSEAEKGLPGETTQEQTPAADTAAGTNAGEEAGGKSPEEQAEEAQKQAEQREIRELQARDREVRAHEQAHLGALGAYRSGGASFQYTTGPDGKQYAVGGEVPVDVSPEATPEQTVRKAETVRRAALAPAEPSGADRAVAAQAAQLAAEARAELQQKNAEETAGGGETTEAAASSSTAGETAQPGNKQIGETSISSSGDVESDDEREAAEFFSGKLVGASPSAFRASSGYAERASERGARVSVSA